MMSDKVESNNNGENEPLNNANPISNEISIENENVQNIILPLSFKECSRSDLITLIARMLSSLIAMNDMILSIRNNTNGQKDNKPSQVFHNKNQLSSLNLTRFHSRVPPNISIYNYLVRLTKYASLEHSVLLCSLYYIDLLSSVYPEFQMNSLTVHRFLLTATTVASKGLCDSFCTNSHYAKVGGVHCNELNILESEFLRRVNYRVIPRSSNIEFCKLEKQHDTFTIDSCDINVQNLNGSYEVLNVYYHRIVQLVGPLNASPDKSKNINYALASIPPPENIIASSTTEQSQSQSETKSSCIDSKGNENADTEMKPNDTDSIPYKRCFDDVAENVSNISHSTEYNKKHHTDIINK